MSLLLLLAAPDGWLEPQDVAATSADEFCPSLAQDGSGKLWVVLRRDYGFYYSQLVFYASENLGEFWQQVLVYYPHGEVGSPQLVTDPEYTPSIVYAVFPVLTDGSWRLGVLSFSAGDPSGTQLFHLIGEGIREATAAIYQRRLYIAAAKGDSLILLVGSRFDQWELVGSWPVDSPRAPRVAVANGKALAACVSGSSKVVVINAFEGYTREFSLPYPVQDISLALGPEGAAFLAVSVEYPGNGDIYGLYSDNWGFSWNGFWFDVSSWDARWPRVITGENTPYFWLLYGVDTEGDGFYNLRFSLAKRWEAGSRSGWGVSLETDSLALDNEEMGATSSGWPLSTALVREEDGLVLGVVWNGSYREGDRDVLFVRSSSPPYIGIPETGSPRQNSPTLFKAGEPLRLGLPDGSAVRVFSPDGRLTWEGTVQGGILRVSLAPGLYIWTSKGVKGRLVVVP